MYNTAHNLRGSSRRKKSSNLLSSFFSSLSLPRLLSMNGLKHKHNWTCWRPDKSPGRGGRVKSYSYSHAWAPGSGGSLATALATVSSLIKEQALATQVGIVAWSELWHLTKTEFVKRQGANEKFPDNGRKDVSASTQPKHPRLHGCVNSVTYSGFDCCPDGTRPSQPHTVMIWHKYCQFMSLLSTENMLNLTNRSWKWSLIAHGLLIPV